MKRMVGVFVPTSPLNLEIVKCRLGVFFGLFFSPKLLKIVKGRLGVFLLLFFFSKAFKNRERQTGCFFFSKALKNRKRQTGRFFVTYFVRLISHALSFQFLFFL